MLSNSTEPLLVHDAEAQDTFLEARLVHEGDRGTYRLNASGLWHDKRRVLALEDCVGVRREGCELVFVSYAKTAGPSLLCCSVAQECRERGVFALEAESEDVAKTWHDVSFKSYRARAYAKWS